MKYSYEAEAEEVVVVVRGRMADTTRDWAVCVCVRKELVTLEVGYLYVLCCLCLFMNIRYMSIALWWASICLESIC